MTTPVENTSPTQEKLEISVQQLRKAAVMLRAINHPLRQQILQMIFEKKQMTVTELYIALRLEQSVTSQHLAILRRAGFVHTHRNGKHIRYSVNEEKIERMEELIASFLE